MPTRYAQQRTISTQLIVEEHISPATGATVPRRDLGFFDKCEGLGLEADDVKYGEYPVSVGPRSREDATLRRPFSEASSEEAQFLETNISAPVTLIQNYKGDDGLPLGIPRTYTGVLKGCQVPDSDATGNERSELAVTCIMNVAS